MIDVLGALADEGAAFELALRRAPASEFGRLTDCPPWTLSELVVRVAASIRIAEFTPAAPDSVLREGADLLLPSGGCSVLLSVVEGPVGVSRLCGI